MTGTVDNPVEHNANDKQSDKTENNPAPVMKYKVTGTDNEYITNHNHSSKRYIFVFIDDGCDNIETGVFFKDHGDNICSTCTSIVVESDTQTYTAHGCTDNAGHEILPCTE